MPLANGQEGTLGTKSRYEGRNREPSPLNPYPYFPAPFFERPLFTRKSPTQQTELAAEPLPPGRLTGPVVFISRLREIWSLGIDDVIRILGYESGDREYVEDILKGVATLRGRDVKDRIKNLVRIRTILASIFRNEQAENEWLREPHGDLGNLSPRHLLLEGSMDNMLLVKEFVEYMGGQ